MGRLLAVLAIACVGLTAVATADAAHKKPPKLKVTYLEDSGVVQPGQIDGFNESCPKAAPNAIGGYFGTDSTVSTPVITMSDMGSYGKGDRKWTSSVRDLSSDPQKYFVGAVCANGGPYKRIVKKSSVEAGKDNGFDLTCPAKAPHPLSGFFFPDAEDSGQLQLAASNPTGTRQWTIGVKNVSDKPQGFFVGVTCAPKRQKVAYLASDQLTVDPGTTNGATGSCPARAPHAVGGSMAIQTDSPFGDLTISGSYPTNSKGRTWSTGAVNLGTMQRAFFAGIVCMG